MAQLSSSMGSSGRLAVKKIKAPGPPLAWKIRNMARWGYLFGRAGNWAAKRFSALTGIPTMTSELRAVLIRADGSIVNYGVVSYRVVTTAFVNFLVDQLQVETSIFGDFKYHDSGVGITAAVVADTAIETTDGESRVAGTQAEGASPNIYQSVGTITYTTTKAITEHGLFNDLTAGTMIDRHVFAAINVVATDSVQYTYEWTAASGG